MNLDVFEGIVKYEKDICPLRSLIDVLKKKSTGPPTSILEIRLLNSFSETSELIPQELFSPRRIIEYMMEMHGNAMKIIFTNPSYVEKFVYKYNSECGKEEKYVFSNNMMFYEDIIIICYLHCIMAISDSYKYETFRAVINLIRIMKKKYLIYDQSNDNSRYVTWFRIAYSYPSITFSIFYHNTVDFSVHPYTIFATLNLPKIFYIPLLASIIPKLDDTTPLALLLAFIVFIYSKDRKHGIIPLRNLWQYVFELYNSKAFPMSLKLQLCQMWGIVHIEENEYKFASYFKAARDDAKFLITELRKDKEQTVLEQILSYV